jgi:YYY domain-containing protein
VLYIVIWWLALQLLGLAALPLAFRLFQRLPDRGYAFARPLGLLLTGYLFWLGANLGLLQNTQGGVLLALIAVAGLSWLAYHRWPGRDETRLLPWLGEHWRLVVVVEVVFALAFAGWAWFRGFSPDLMTTGGEKFMEIAFINAILRSEAFPPLDPWLSGFSISYYYFGYVMTALVTRFTGVPATSAFTLGIAHLFALTVTGAFGAAYNLVQAGREGEGEKQTAVGYGLLGATFVALMGNLEGLLEAMFSKGLGSEAFWKWVDVPGLLESGRGTGQWFPGVGWWWWRGSRVISDLDLLGRPIPIQPIDEFPFFSFILGDMHPHVLALPFVLLAVALAFNLFRGRGRPSWAEIGLLALALGGLSFLNTWDFPIYLGLILLAYGVRRYREFGRAGNEFWKDLGLVATSLFGLGVVFYLPFYVGFRSQAGGILPNLLFPTRLHQYLIMFGPFIFVLLCWLGVLFVQAVKSNGGRSERLGLRALLTWLGVLLLFPVGMLASVALLLATKSGRAFVQSVLDMEAVRAVIGQQTIGSLLAETVRVRLSDPWTWMFLALLIAVALVLVWRWLRSRDDASLSIHPDPTTTFALLLALMGLTLTLAVEWVYLRDNFGVRMNTVFKFYFQGWVLMGLASAYGSYYLLERVRGRGWALFGVGMTILIGSGLVYTIFAGYSRAEGFNTQNWTLDGAAWIARDHPDDDAAIEWLSAHAKGAPVVLETPGKSYNYEGRVSALTGLPSVLGWSLHEGQWRGSYEEQSKREPDIEAIYSTVVHSDEDATRVRTLLDKYDVTYVYIGPTERRRYPQAGLEKFEWLLEPVFRQGQVTIYQVP